MEENKPKFVFDHRLVFLKNLEELIDQQILTFKDLIAIFRYAIEKQGISGDTISRMMVKYTLIISNDELNLNKFLTNLRHIIELNGNAFVDIDIKFLQEILDLDVLTPFRKK